MTTGRPGRVPGAHGAILALLLAVLLVLMGCSPVADDATPTSPPSPSPSPSLAPSLSPSPSPSASLSPDDAVAHVLRSTVEVRALFEGGRGALGTGVMVSRDGLYVTNDHVLLGGNETLAAQIFVVTADGRQAEAFVVHRAPDVDLAFLQAEVAGPVPAEFQTDLAALRRGDEIFAIGAPRHFDDRVVRGTVRRVLGQLRIAGRPGLDTLIVTDAPLEPGFSGGPLADGLGRVAGINVAGVPMDGMEGVRSLAIPAATVLQTAAEAGVPQG